MDGVRSAVKRQEELAAPYLDAIRDRQYWVTVIDDINSRLPQNFVWITGFGMQELKEEKKGRAAKPPKGAAADAPKPEKVLMLSGLYLENPRNALVVDDFVASLNESTLYQVNKERLKRSVPNDTEWAYEYSIPLELKNPISPK